MSHLMRHLEQLSVGIGPRGSATPAEAQAAEYIASELEGMGLETKKEPFKSVTSFSWPFLIIYMLFPLSAAVYFSRPVMGLILAALGLILFFLESNTFPILSSFLPGQPSQNVRAVIPARSKAIRQVVITAHYDSSRWALNFKPGMVENFRSSYLMMFGSMVAMVLLFAFAVATPFPKPLFGFIALLPALFLFITIGFLVHREIVGRYTHGANDNASGTAVLLEVARALSKNPPATIGVEIVATGCEEAGTVGMIQYLKRHFVPKHALFINLDNLGAGKLSVITEEGLLIPKKASTTLLDAAHETVEAKKLPVDFRPYKLLTTDATAVMMRGYGAVGVMGIDEKGLLPNWHWVTDTFENVKPENLEQARELVLGILRELER